MEHRWRRRTYGCAAALSAAVLTLAGCGAAPGPADAGQGRATHLGSHVSPDDPTQRHLETIRATAGIAAALDELGRVESGAPLLESRPHQRAHLLGSAQFRSLGGDLDSAFRGCDMRFQGGCHHGVLQEYFRSRPPIDGGSLRGLCDRLAAGSAPVVHASCVHGVGHGLFAYFDETLAGPLSRCGQLVAAEQNECRGGVFMENLVVSLTGHGGSSGSGNAVGFRPTDPHYPCDVVEAAARPSCYLYQPIAILYLNGHDVAATFASCDRAAASDVPSCYFGIGGAISGMTHQDIARSDQLCRLGAPRYQAWCFENLAAILVDTSLSTAGAVAQCAAAPRWFGPHCVEVVADRVGSNWSDPNDRARECGRFPGPTASEQCRRLAAVA